MKFNINWKITSVLVLMLSTGVFYSWNEDILDQANPNAITPKSFWKTSDDATKGILGAYSPFTHIWNYARFEIFLSDYRDDVVNAYGTSERTAIGAFNGISRSNGTKWVWSTHYQAITRANEVIANVPNIDMDASLRDAIVGEAHFIRGYHYMQLVNNWLNVPLINQPFSDIEDPEAIAQASPDEVWQQVLSDFTSAQGKLPQSWDSGNLGRATWGSATAFLGKAMLYRNDYAGAKNELKKVMDSGLYSLTADYADNFTQDAENNSESLFEIQFIFDGNGGWGGDNAGTGKGSAFHPDLAPAGFTGQDGMQVNKWALDLFLDERTVNGEVDPRAYETFFWDTDETTTYQGKILKSTTYEGKTYSEVYSDGRTTIYGNKHLDTRQGYKGSQTNGWHQAGNNLRLMRYADVLLMFAEAEVGGWSGGAATQAAVDAVNLVRARVDLAPLDMTMTMTDIEHERVKELSLERTRYHDLLRWGLVVERIVNHPELKSSSSGTGAYQPGREYIDIPQNEIDANPNIQHNPGYN